MWTIFSNEDWNNIESILQASIIASSLEDIKSLIIKLARIPDDSDLKSLDALQNEVDLISLFKQIKDYALNFPTLFPCMSLPILKKSRRFTRSQVLCLLCHMTLCSIKNGPHHLYWTNFEIWLRDGRCCTIVYLQTLFVYFQRMFSSESALQGEILFQKRECDELPLDVLRSCTFTNVQLELNGKIGELPLPEVSFANKDIGFGITGTQEEMIFGASPELCIAMLFCETLKDREAIFTKGAYKVAEFSGYGLNISTESFPKDWRERQIIAIDAMDFYEETLKKQFEEDCLNRELLKAYTGFSFVTPPSAISTGHWGCGAFGGNMQLKALIQLTAASMTGNNLIYYCFGDVQFFEEFSKFLNFLISDKVSVYALWECLKKCEVEEGNNLFLHLQSRMIEYALTVLPI